MTVSLNAADGRLVLDGVVDFDNADSVCKEGENLLRQSAGDIVLDVSGLASDSSITVAVIVQWARSAATAGKAFRLAGVPDQLAAIIRVSGLQQALGLAGPATTSVEAT